MKKKLKNKHFFLCSLSGWGKAMHTTGEFDIHVKKVSSVVNTFDYPQLLRWELGIWNGS